MIDGIWFGTPASLQVVLDMEAALKADPKLYANPWVDDDEEHSGPESRLLEYRDNVAIVKVEGSLTNKKSWYNRYFGITAYEEITDAVAEAADNAVIDSIVMAYASGGGTAAGVKDASDFIKMVDKDVKPVYSYTSASAFSAAYWLYSGGRQAFASEMGQVGSIGAIAIHASYKDAYEKAGIQHTVFREGEFKALGQPVEKLDDKAKGDIQSHLKQANSFFLDAVIGNRGLSMSEHSQWGEGKTFFAAEGMRVGLVDQVRSLDQVVQRFSTAGSSSVGFDGGIAMPKGAEGSVEEQVSQQLDGDAPQTVVDEQTAAKLAAGVAPEVALEGNQADAQAAKPEEVAEVGLEESNAEVGVEEESPAQLSDTALAKELGKAELRAEQLQEKLAAQEGLVSSMQSIVLDAIDNKTFAIGGTSIDLSHLTPELAVSHYEKVNAQFHAAFKIGPKSVATVDANLETVDPDGGQAERTPQELMLAAAKRQKQA